MTKGDNKEKKKDDNKDDREEDTFMHLIPRHLK